MSDHYTVLARRFRPQTFADVVGQEHVGRAIQNAIKAGRVAHAYLFTGARGVGKTSTARIFAKALNCPNVANGVPCNECDVCTAIGDGADVDVLEIDGASNRGIDDIRQLRANVNIRSMRSPFKVYIIDEVHMLTKEAFNALLKTLEEPPPNVKFIFCTTEPQKVPDTILSRCQRFDFGTITSDRIGTRLEEIAAAEGIAVDDEAIAMVARRAAGSMRDSQSLFDQLLAFGGENVSADDVHRLFGTAPDERIVQLMDAVVGKDRATALTLVHESLDAGVRLESLTDQIVAYLRDLLVLSAGATTVELSSVSDRFLKTLTDQAASFGLRTATAALQIFADTKQKMSRTVHGRPLLELAIVRLTILEDLDGLAALVQAARSGQLNVGSGLPAAAASVKKKVDRPQRVVTAPEVSPDVPPNIPTESVADSQSESQGTEADHRPVQQAGPPTIELSETTFEDVWQRLLKLTPEKLGNALSDAKRKQLTTDGKIVVTVGTEFALRFLNRRETKERLDSLTEGLTGSVVPFEFDAQVPAVSTSVQDRRVEPEMKKKSAVDEDAFVQTALEVFGGQLIQVKSAPLVPVVDTPADELSELEPIEDDDDA